MCEGAGVACVVVVGLRWWETGRNVVAQAGWKRAELQRRKGGWVAMGAAPVETTLDRLVSSRSSRGSRRGRRHWRSVWDRRVVVVTRMQGAGAGAGASAGQLCRLGWWGKRRRWRFRGGGGWEVSLALAPSSIGERGLLGGRDAAVANEQTGSRGSMAAASPRGRGQEERKRGAGRRREDGAGRRREEKRRAERSGGAQTTRDTHTDRGCEAKAQRSTQRAGRKQARVVVVLA